MRIGNIHQFTEHHRCYSFRDFSLSSLDHKVLQLLYQPMLGTGAIALFQQLYYLVPDERLGYSALEPQRKLLLGLGLEMNEQGRRQLADYASRLEAVGLLQTSRLVLPSGDDLIYEYELAKPLSPDEFFNNQHLTMYLRDKIGNFAIIGVREQFAAAEPDELAHAQLEKENISVPFYELFKLNTHVIDNELEQALAEIAPARTPARTPAEVPQTATRIQYGELILRFPRHAANRAHVERLRGNERRMATLNYIAYKFGLGVVDLCRLLDEDGVFAPDGELLEEELQHRANLIYRQDRKRSEERERQLTRHTEASASAVEEADSQPQPEAAVQAADQLDVPQLLQGRCDKAQYNMLMRNEPHTRFVQRFFPGAVPEWLDRLLERLNLNYRLPDAVINVLLHYVLGMLEKQRISKAFLDAIASNMLLRQVDTFEKAVRYVREQQQLELERVQRTAGQGTDGRTAMAGQKATRAAGGAARSGRKPSLPIIEHSPEEPAITEEELEELRQLARRLDGQGG